jgi:hypothetical protein
MRKDKIITKFKNISKIKNEKEIMERIKMHPFLLGLEYCFKDE